MRYRKSDSRGFVTPGFRLETQRQSEAIVARADIQGHLWRGPVVVLIDGGVDFHSRLPARQLGMSAGRNSTKWKTLRRAVPEWLEPSWSYAASAEEDELDRYISELRFLIVKLIAG